jgi:CelD/BcsL family acetyltransferase involved in cellulose biosynthesis
MSSHARTNLRRRLRMAAEEGLSICEQLSPKQFEEWLVIYHSRFAELGATCYPDEFFRAAYQLAVESGTVEFWGVLHGDKLVGGTMFLNSGATVDYFLSVFDSAYRHLAPSSYLLFEAFTKFRACGTKHFNWQSSPSRSGVYEYKASWGARESTHTYLSVLFRPDSRLLRLSPQQLSEHYPLRFVIPHPALQGAAAVS